MIAPFPDHCLLVPFYCNSFIVSHDFQCFLYYIKNRSKLFIVCGGIFGYLS